MDPELRQLFQEIRQDVRDVSRAAEARARWEGARDLACVFAAACALSWVLGWCFRKGKGKEKGKGAGKEKDK